MAPAIREGDTELVWVHESRCVELKLTNIIHTNQGKDTVKEGQVSRHKIQDFCYAPARWPHEGYLLLEGQNPVENLGQWSVIDKQSGGLEEQSSHHNGCTSN
jgi:hypothetical protein